MSATCRALANSQQIEQDSYDPRLKEADLRKPLPKAPFFRTTKGMLVRLLAVAIVIGAVVGAVVGSTSRGKTSADGQGSSSVQFSTPPNTVGLQPAPSQSSQGTSRTTSSSFLPSPSVPGASSGTGTSVGALSLCVLSCVNSAATAGGCQSM